MNQPYILLVLLLIFLVRVHRLNLKVKLTRKTCAASNTKDIKIAAVPLKYLSHFWRTLEIVKLILF